MLEWLLQKFGGTIIGAIISALMNAVRLRRLDRERDDAIAGRALAEQRQAELEEQLKRKGRMSNAQAAAPSTRDELAERLRREARSEGGADTADPVPVVEGRGQGS